MNVETDNLLLIFDFISFDHHKWLFIFALLYYIFGKFKNELLTLENESKTHIILFDSMTYRSRKSQVLAFQFHNFAPMIKFLRCLVAFCMIH